MKVALFLLQAVLIFPLAGIAAVGQSDNSVQDERDPFGHSLRPKRTKKKKLEAVHFHPVVPEEDVVRVETKLVVDDVLVMDKDGTAVKGLTKDDFLIYEDGVKQDLALFSKGDDRNAIGRSIVLIIDYSGSERPYIENSVEAAKVLIDGLNPQDRLAIITDDVEVLSNFTTDRVQLKERLETLKQRSLAGRYGKSLQFSALMAALNEMLGETSLRSVVIFQTDGDEFPSLKRFVSTQGDTLGNTRFTFDELVDTAERVRATIYTIVPNSTFVGISKKVAMEKAESEFRAAFAEIEDQGPIVGASRKMKFQKQVLLDWAEARKRDEIAIKRLAERTGGWSSNIESPENAAAVYSQILREFNKRYLIGYYPSNQDARNERRKIEIQIRGRPEYTVRGKKEYIVEK